MSENGKVDAFGFDCVCHIFNFELPEDIVTERGYPQLTDQAKRKILGGNLARLHGMEVPA